MTLRAALQQSRIVNTLRPRDDFLSPDKDVEGAGVVWVVDAGHGVEGSDGERVPVQHVEVGVVLLFDEAPESALQLGGEVAVGVGLHFWEGYIRRKKWGYLNFRWKMAFGFECMERLGKNIQRDKRNLQLDIDINTTKHNKITQ
jgi:hypothetical protein